MNFRRAFPGTGFAAIALLVIGLFATGASGQAPVAAPVEFQTPETVTVDGATAVLDDVMSTPGREIPAALLAEAQAIAIVPALLKGGFIVGIRHGRGVVVMRDEARQWHAPMFISITGGSFGWQIGLQASDIVLVFRTRNSVLGLTRGKFTLGADASAAAGPIGREMSAATDAALRAEIYSYSRTRGLFAGLALDGSAIQIDPYAQAAYYQTMASQTAAGQPPVLPPSAQRLMQRVLAYSRP